MEKPSEDLIIDLAGLLIAPTFPGHKSKGEQKAWFHYWEKQLARSIKKNITPYRSNRKKS
jgi:hypothetical protein